jgi:hypothetical protein
LVVNVTFVTLRRSFLELKNSPWKSSQDQQVTQI